MEEEIAVTEDQEIEDEINISNYVLSEVSSSLEELEKMIIDQPLEAVEVTNQEDAAIQTQEQVNYSYKLQDDNETQMEENNEFDQQQKEFLLNKTVLKDIISEDGQTIAKKGNTINEKIIKNAKSKGKLIEIIMNSK